MRTIKYFCIIPFLFRVIWAECSDLDYADCIYWSEYCEWNEDSQECYEIGGGGGGLSIWTI